MAARPRQPLPPTLNPLRRAAPPGLVGPAGTVLVIALAVCLLVGGALGWPGQVQASLLHLAGPAPAGLGVSQGHLAPCATPAHCARETWPASDADATLQRLLPVVLSLEGVEVVTSEPGYLRATATSRLFGFVDDLELHADASAGVIEARSSSRLGDSDLGVNARRLGRLREALEKLEGR